MSAPVVIVDDVGMWKARAAVAGIAFGSGLLAMAAMGWHYDGRLEAMHKAHKDEIASMRRANTREKNIVRNEVRDELRALRDQFSSNASCRSGK